MTPDKKVEKAPLVPPFVRFVASAIPMVFDDSMSYYECLAALTHYLQHDIVDVINNNATVTEEYIQLTKDLKEYVENYFANLDVQEEINNKLDEMALDGTLQEIITQYIQANVAWTFDTVADMKSATNLVNGSYAQTLGFHSLNDGGGALYYITDTGTADEMSVIAVGDLYAVIVTEKANVKQFGAYGDDTNADDTAITGAYNYAVANNKVLYFPKATYKVSTSLELKHCVIDCEGTINNSSTIILGANSNASTITNVKIYRINNIQIEGAKVSQFDIGHAGDVVLSVDGNISTNTSIAYCKYNGIEVASLTLTGQNNGWINENEFNIKRCRGNLSITGDGTYSHNNNHFNNICIEGSDKTITIDYGHNNFITYRGEQRPTVVLGDNLSLCYGNFVEYQYNSTAYNIFQNDYTQNGSGVIQPEWTPKYKSERILDINKYNAKNVDTTIYIDSNNEILGAWSNLYETDKLDADLPFALNAKCDKNAIRIEFICYDASDNQVEGNCGGQNIYYQNNAYNMTTNAKDIYFAFYPSATVKKIKFRIYTGNNVTFNTATLDLIQPFLNYKVLPNKINQYRRYSNGNPGDDANTNHYWTVGDFVYCKKSSEGVMGWFCQYSGNPGTWKPVALDS